MMAKMFYTLDEARQTLGMSEEELKQLAREGKLREFRDGAKLMFKAEQIESLRDRGRGGDQIDLHPADSAGPISLADSANPSGTGSGSVISLADTRGGTSPGYTPAGRSGSMPGLTPGDSAAGRSATGPGILGDDSGLDLAGGQSGSYSMSSPGAGMSATGFSSPGGTGSGIGVLGPDEATADPGDQTAVGGGSFGGEQINLESMGSGSGLLDLTRGDDTSLGADVLDETTPGGTTDGTAALTGAGIGTPVDTRGGRVVAVAPTAVDVADPMAPAFGGAALAAALFAILGLAAVAAGAAGVSLADTFLAFLSGYGLWILFAIGIGMAVVFFVIGLVLGRRQPA